MYNLNQVYYEGINKELTEICKTKNVVIWGTGVYGRNVYKIFDKYNFRDSIVAFCDNSKLNLGQNIGGLTVLSYDEIKRKYKDNVVFFICSSEWLSIKAQLISLGEEQNIYIPENFEYLRNEVVLRNWSNKYDSLDIEQFNKLISKTEDILEDKESKDTLSARINLIKTKDFDCLNDLNLNKQQYFLDDFYKLTEEETYLDLGAWDGDTVLNFINKVNVKYNKIIAFEPLPKAYNQLKNLIESHNFKNVETYNMGSWNKKCEIEFIDNLASSSINLNGKGNKISVDTLDNLFINTPLLHL